MIKKYLTMANGSKLALNEQSDPEKELRGNSPVPDQDLGDGLAIVDGQLTGLNCKGGSVADTQEIIDKLIKKATADFRKLNFNLGISASAGRMKPYREWPRDVNK